ncbi:hypothetical protein VNI00_016295 [Paramarasmius palmivorus]|uniref:BTB domain-containing protein n=1 Tax=Paramarasmius palmivorus TaxID=297713 RepID=A0AAW0BFZ1_9AGAR
MSSHDRVPKIADSPFDANDADIILQTSDNIHFYFYRLILSLVSPFFKDMFALPLSAEQKSSKGIPIVPVTEDSVTLDRTLRFVYPGMEPPTLSHWEDVEPVFEAFIKYQMEKTAPFASILSCLLQTANIPPTALDISKDKEAKHWQAYANMRIIAKVERFRDSLPPGTTGQAIERALCVPFFELSMAYVDELDGWSAKDYVSMMKRCQAEMLSHRIPSFGTWEERDSRWSYECWQQEPDFPGPRLSKKLMVDWYESTLIPSLREGSLSDMHIIPYEPEWACTGCGQACSGMVRAATEIFREEIGRMLSMPAVCYFFVGSIKMLKFWNTE